MIRGPYDGFANLTTGGIIANHARNYPENLAVVDVDRNKRYTYREFNNRINQLANGLLSLGMEHGDLVAVYLTDRVEWLEILYAVNKIGAAWIPCNIRFVAEELASQLKHAQPKWLFFSEATMDVVEVIKKEVPSIANYIIMEDRQVDGYISYETILENVPDTEPQLRTPVSAKDLAGITYTSGTTGVPKGVMHNHRSFIGWAMSLVLDCGLFREDRMLNPYPMFHFGGVIVSMQIFIAGGVNYILGKFNPEKFLQLIEKEKITIFMAVPTIIHAIVGLPQEIKVNYPMLSVNRFYSSSAPLYEETKETFLKQWPHLEMFSAYTSTEMVFTTLRPKDQLRKKNCVGRPAFGVELKIVDKKGNDLPNGQAGLVYAKGVTRCSGYYKNPDANEKVSLGDWVTCEDVGYFDDEGYLYLVDRDKDMIISGGENIASVEVENVLLRHPAIFEAAVVGVRDEQWGERVEAIVSLKTGAKTMPEEVIEWCKDKLAGYKRPRKIHIVDEVPKTPVGKISKKELREQLNQFGEIDTSALS